MVGQCYAWGSVLGGSAAEPIDPAGAVQQRVFRMNVKVDELIQVGVGLRASGSPAPSGWGRLRARRYPAKVVGLAPERE